MSDDSANMVRIGCPTTSLSDIVGILCRQILVVLRIEKMQELGRLSLHHHLGWVWESWRNCVNDLMFATEWHLSVPITIEKRVN